MTSSAVGQPCGLPVGDAVLRERVILILVQMLCHALLLLEIAFFYWLFLKGVI